MAAPSRLLPKTHVTTVLLVHECVRVKDYTHASLWRTPSGFCFTVPREGPHEQCDEMTLSMVLKEVAQYGTPGGSASSPFTGD
jgi:hypothetical protein